jgi:hypothetical protein
MKQTKAEGSRKRKTLARWQHDQIIERTEADDARYQFGMRVLWVILVAACAAVGWVRAFRRHGDPRVITLDGFEPTHAALRRMGMNNEFNYRWEGAVQIRTCPYLNNVVEQDHRRIKARWLRCLGSSVSSMPGGSWPAWS